jgi:hypothetical protein
MYTLHDTFNNRLISRHRTIAAAARAEISVQRRVKRANGPSSRLPTMICENGVWLSEEKREELYQARMAINH